MRDALARALHRLRGHGKPTFVAWNAGTRYFTCSCGAHLWGRG